jgi:nucleotide-binding universal stress UspA family protein
MKERRILVPLDDSPLSAQTVERLLTLQENISVPLTLLHVLDLGRLASRGFAEATYAEFEQRARAEARLFLAGRKEQFAAAGVAVEPILKEGEVRETICALADSGDYDLLVVGRNAQSELRTLLFGQVPNYLIHHVKCPVLIV